MNELEKLCKFNDYSLNLNLISSISNNLIHRI